MNKRNLAAACGGIALLAACAPEPQPRSVAQFVDDPIVLEATMVRCNQDRGGTRYDTECINARQAVAILEAREERERYKELEAQSERKRQALRRTQEAAAEARRRAAEAERLRREAEYLAQFGELPPDDVSIGQPVEGAANAPGVRIPEEDTAADAGVSGAATAPVPDAADSSPAASGEPPRDLNAIREELQRRAGETGE